MSRDMAFDQMFKVWQIHHDKAKIQTLQPHNNSDFAIKQDDDDDLFSESDTMSTTEDNSSTESCSSSNEFIEEDEGIVNPPHHCECHCGDNNNHHLQQVALDSTFMGTVSVMHELLFQSNFFPKILKKYEGCQGNTINFV